MEQMPDSILVINSQIIIIFCSSLNSQDFQWKLENIIFWTCVGFHNVGVSHLVVRHVINYLLLDTLVDTYTRDPRRRYSGERQTLPPFRDSDSAFVSCFRADGTRKTKQFADWGVRMVEKIYVAIQLLVWAKSSVRGIKLYLQGFWWKYKSYWPAAHGLAVTC